MINEWALENYEKVFYHLQRGFFKGTVEQCITWSGRVSFVEPARSLCDDGLERLPAIEGLHYENNGHLSFSIAMTGLATKESAMAWVERKMEIAIDLITPELMKRIGDA